MSDADFVLSAALSKLRDIRKSKRHEGLWRRLLLERLVGKLTAMQETACKEADGEAFRVQVDVRRRGQKRKRVGEEVEERDGKRRQSSAELRWREERAREFIAALPPCKIDMDALDEELGPEPDIEFLDD